MKGTYVLEIMNMQNISIKVGSLGETSFPRGFFSYVGSAMADSGSATLINRVRRHLKLRKEKKLHWHIDYLLGAKSTEIIRLILIPSKVRRECIIAREMATLADSSIKAFGSSDCGCESHLFHFKDDMPW